MSAPVYGICPHCGKELRPANARWLLFFVRPFLACTSGGRCGYRRRLRGQELADVIAKFEVESTGKDR